MNKAKRSNLVRVIAFFLIATIMVCTFGFTSDGWLIDSSTNISSNNNTQGSSGSLVGQKPPESEKIPEIYIPEYINALTGLETTKDKVGDIPLSLVMDPDSPLYGTSNADITIEVPIENGQTRMLSIFTDLSNLWKVGSLAKTRGFITDLASSFGAHALHIGREGSNGSIGTDLLIQSIDLASGSGYCYSEYTYFCYTNASLIQNAIASMGISPDRTYEGKLPFSFTEYGRDPIQLEKKASVITIDYSANSSTTLKYDEITEKYTLLKCGAEKKDLLNDSNHEYTNCFVLFVDSVTYESSLGLETVLKIADGGYGFYVTKGSVMNILWNRSSDGSLIFINENGENLTVNRGTSFISFVKSYRNDTVLFS